MQEEIEFVKYCGNILEIFQYIIYIKAQSNIIS